MPNLVKIRSELLAQVDQKIKKDPKGKEALPKGIIEIIDSDEAMSLAQCKVILKSVNPRDTEMALRLSEAGIMESRLKLLREKEVRVIQEMDEPRETFVA